MKNQQKLVKIIELLKNIIFVKYFFSSIKMDKEKKRFSRQSTADFPSSFMDSSKQVKIERKNKQKIQTILKTKEEISSIFKKQESIVTHLTKRSIFDRKSSQESEGRPKSMRLVYRGRYKQPGVFGLQDKQFMNLYLNDPFARQKIKYVLKKNDEKLQKDKMLASSVNGNNVTKSKDLSILADYNLGEIQEIIKEKTFVRCKSESDLIEAQECLHYKELIRVYSLKGELKIARQQNLDELEKEYRLNFKPIN